MNEPISILELVLNASIVVQLVMAILVMASLVSWVLIFQRAFLLSSVKRLATNFENEFWSGQDLRLAMSNQASLSVVAPGISEALIATAIGLFAAIPAVIAYNRYSAQVEVMMNRFETLSDEFSAILNRSIADS